MDRRTELHLELQKLENQLTELMNIADPGPGDLNRTNDVCDSIEEIRTELRSIDTREGKIRLPSESKPNEEQFRRWGEFFQAVACAAPGMEPGRQIGRFITGRVYSNILNREIRSTGLEESTPSLGGFVVMEDFATEVFRHAQSTYRLYNRVRKIPISANSNKLKYPFVDETSRANGSRQGGIRAYWLEEGGTKTASKPKFGQLELSLSKLILLTYATDELLEDAVALGAYLYEGFAEEVGFKLDDAIINGTGAGQPLGILQAACLVSVSKETGQSASTLVWENVKKMFARLWGGAFNNAIWLINQNVIPELYSMTQSVGAGGVPVFQPANLPRFELFNRPIVVMEQCQTIGTTGDILLVDPTQYLVIEKGGLQMATSIHVQFTTDETTFRGVFRVDGQPMWNAALTPYKGTSSTQSPFVALASRT